MNDSVKKTIEAVIRTLDKIEVKGRDNMDMMLGCIISLERILTASEEKPEEEDAKTDG